MLRHIDRQNGQAADRLAFHHPCGGGELTPVGKSRTRFIIDKAGELRAIIVAAGDGLAQYPAHGIIAQAGDRAFGIGLGDDARGIIETAAPIAKVRVVHADAVAQQVIAIEPAVLQRVTHLFDPAPEDRACSGFRQAVVPSSLMRAVNLRFASSR